MGPGNGHWVNARSDRAARLWLEYRRSERRPTNLPSTRRVVIAAAVALVALSVLYALLGFG